MAVKGEVHILLFLISFNSFYWCVVIYIVHFHFFSFFPILLKYVLFFCSPFLSIDTSPTSFGVICMIVK